MYVYFFEKKKKFVDAISQNLYITERNSIYGWHVALINTAYVLKYAIIHCYILFLYQYMSELLLFFLVCDDKIMFWLSVQLWLILYSCNIYPSACIYSLVETNPVRLYCVTFHSTALNHQNIT